MALEAVLRRELPAAVDDPVEGVAVGKLIFLLHGKDLLRLSDANHGKENGDGGGDGGVEHSGHRHMLVALPVGDVAGVEGEDHCTVVGQGVKGAGGGADDPDQEAGSPPWPAACH